MTSLFERHEITWTREKASRFWQFLAPRPSEQKNYFSHAVGPDLIARARQRGVSLSGRVLDYGCGPGHLLEHLLAHGVPCEGADFDRVALDAVNQRLQRNPQFRGTTLIEALPSSLPAASFDVVFFIETIEHLIGDELPKTLQELQRIVRPGGSIVVTTPNNEDLEASKRMCPECGCVFHTVQHVSSWDRSKLEAMMTTHGFTTQVCEALSLRPASPLNWMRVVADVVRSKQPRHLLYVGKKA